VEAPLIRWYTTPRFDFGIHTLVEGWIYLLNKSKSAAVLRNRDKKREIMYALMTPCEHCGDFDVAYMDWHHTDPNAKEQSVSHILRSKGLMALLEETEKCICLCANCHRKLHYYETQ